MPNKKPNKASLQSTDENQEAQVVITADPTLIEPEKRVREEARKPLYLKRV